MTTRRERKKEGVRKAYAESIPLSETMVGKMPQHWFCCNYIVVATRKCLSVVNILAENGVRAQCIAMDGIGNEAVGATITYVGTKGDFDSAYGISGEAAKSVRANQEEAGTYSEQIGMPMDSSW